MNADQVKNHIMELEVRDRFIYVTELPSLREIASYRIARAIRFHNSPPEIYNSEKYINLKNYDDDVESLTASPEILDLIKNCLKKIEEEFNLWVHHFSRVLFCLSRRPYKLFRLYSNWCVWLQNGQIDYFKTGMKILRSGQLNEVQKFIISCEYCLENEIKKVSLDALPTDFIANTNYYDDGILFYWIHFLKNTLHEVPVEDYSSAETAIVRNFQRHSRFAIEFFLPCLSEEDQLIVVSEWISNRCRNHFECSVLERLISSLSWDQQRCLLAQKSEEILINLSLHSHSTRCALWAWKYYKDIISDEQFSSLVDKILRQWRDNKRSCPTLIIIWETAYDHQRNFAAQALSNMVIDMCLFRSDTSAIALDFTNRFFPLISEQHTEGIILQKFKMCAQLIDLSVFDSILDVCFSDPDNRRAFRKKFMTDAWTSRHALEYAKQGDFQKLNLLLEYYCGMDAEKAQFLKKNVLGFILLDRERYSDFICDAEKWQGFKNLIDEVYPNDSAMALNLKKVFVSKILRSPEFRIRFDKRLSIRQTVKIIETIFATGDLINVKYMVIRSFEESLKTSSYWENEEVFDETYFKEIIALCLGNDTRLIKYFKKNVSPDIILCRIFYRIYELYQESKTLTVSIAILLERLNKYLMWYLNRCSHVKIFKKIRLIDNSKQLEIFRLISTRKDDLTLGYLLKWYFDGDEEQAQKFRLENFQF